MPSIQFIPDNIKETGNDFPRLKLDAQESARIVVVQQEPTFVYRHVLRAPEIGTDGKAVWHKVERKGEQVDAIKLGFVANHQCLGDYNTIADGRGIDPDNCPMCERSVKTSVIGAPERRFAAHVAKYATKAGTFDIIKPFNAQIQLWIFTETIFTKLVGFQKEFGSLLQHDLKLGPCTNKDFQKFDINVAFDAEWLKTAKSKEFIKEAVEENVCPDLEETIARRKDKKYVLQDIKTVEDRWKIANGVDSDPAPAREALTQDVSNLIGNGKPAPAKKAASKAVIKPAEPVEEAPEPVAPVEDDEPTVVATSDADEDSTESEPVVAPKSLSFDELMNQI